MDYTAFLAAAIQFLSDLGILDAIKAGVIILVAFALFKHLANRD